LRRRNLLLAALLAVTGCSYGFAGGGFPPEVRTIAVIPFENLTSDPSIAQEVNLSVREAVESRLGLRAAGEAAADAIVRGTVRRYEPDQPVAYSGNAAGGTGNQQNQVTVNRRLLQVVVELEITARNREKPLVAKRQFQLQGDYEPGREREGRRKALDLLVTDLVNAAQSQW
jgi:hypothetical protein